MGIKKTCVLLYGSAARGEMNSSSDIDILVLTSSKKIRSLKYLDFEAQFTPMKTMTEMAKSGNLFAAHIAYEATTITDPTRYFQKLKSSLVIKKSYDFEIEESLYLLSYLSKKRIHHSQYHLFNKRVAWCVRTVLIASLAEQGKIIFSPEKLSHEFNLDYISDLIGLRRSNDPKSKNLGKIKKFIWEFGGENILQNNSDTLKAQFKKKKFDVALATLKALQANSSFVDYPV